MIGSYGAYTVLVPGDYQYTTYTYRPEVCKAWVYFQGPEQPWGDSCSLLA